MPSNFWDLLLNVQIYWILAHLLCNKIQNCSNFVSSLKFMNWVMQSPWCQPHEIDLKSLVWNLQMLQCLCHTNNTPELNLREKTSKLKYLKMIFRYLTSLSMILWDSFVITCLYFWKWQISNLPLNGSNICDWIVLNNFKSTIPIGRETVPFGKGNCAFGRSFHWDNCQSGSWQTSKPIIPHGIDSHHLYTHSPLDLDIIWRLRPQNKLELRTWVHNISA